MYARVLTFNKPDTDPDLKVAGLMTASASKEDQVHLELLTKPNYFELLRYSARPYALDIPMEPLSYLHYFTATIPSCYVYYTRMLLFHVPHFPSVLHHKRTSCLHVTSRMYLYHHHTLRCTS